MRNNETLITSTYRFGTVIDVPSDTVQPGDSLYFHFRDGIDDGADVESVEMSYCLDVVTSVDNDQRGCGITFYCRRFWFGPTAIGRPQGQTHYVMCGSNSRQTILAERPLTA